MIKPSIGRVVWYHPAANERIPGQPGDQPFAATVSYVWNDRLVNLGVLTANGTQFEATSVTLVQDGDPVPAERYAEWMPFQLGQAKKYEAAKEPA